MSYILFLKKTLMKKQLLSLTCVILVISLTALFSCHKSNEDKNGHTPDLFPEEKQVLASVQGKVIDNNGDPVAGAQVSSGEAGTLSDADGIFRLDNIKLSSRFGFVKVVKEGYFTGSRSILAAAGSESFVSIKLSPRTSSGSFAASGGGTVDLQTGTSVSFGAASVVNEATGAAYGGTVHVYASFLDPTIADAAQRMPGDLRGIAGDGKETVLQSFGMMVVELEGDGGEKLQIADGKKASITMKIPDALMATAPSTIPLWYFNDTTGRWVEQGLARRVGNQYVGETAHFTWWNCDAPMGAVSFKVHLQDGHGNPLSFTNLRITSPTMGVRGGYTDADGNASGLIPKGQQLTMEAVDNCGDVLVSKHIEASLDNVDLGTLTVADNRPVITLTGTVINCEGAAVDSGFVNAVVEGQVYRAHVTKGAFSLAIARCSGAAVDAVVFAGDYKTLKQGVPVMMTVGTENINMGQLKACGEEVNQYFNISFRGKKYQITLPVDTICYARTNTFHGFFLDSTLNRDGISMAFFIKAADLNGVGTCNAFGSDFAVDGIDYQQYSNAGVNVMKCLITQFGPVGGAITGSISGDLFDPQNNVYSLSCDFKVIRTK